MLLIWAAVRSPWDTEIACRTQFPDGHGFVDAFAGSCCFRKKEPSRHSELLEVRVQTVSVNKRAAPLILSCGRELLKDGNTSVLTSLILYRETKIEFNLMNVYRALGVCRELGT